MDINIKKLEVQYLQAKIKYYEGNEIMTDAQFDALEKILKEHNSKVTEQVGGKRKDFDFKHITRMKSLAKIQMEESGSVINYQTPLFMNWLNKGIAKSRRAKILSSPKFDGNAITINYLYSGEQFELLNIATRGDGTAGKDLTERLKSKVPNILNLLKVESDEGDTIEIRCEVVISISLFNKKYLGSAEEGKFANPRNYVAGVLGKDDWDKTKVSELTIIPLSYLINSDQVDQTLFSDYLMFETDWNREIDPMDYEMTVDYYINLRKTFDYPLDGIVFAFPFDCREAIGENDHDPDWAVAVKFIPDEVITGYRGIELNLSKRGEICPVILLEPVELMGTTVKRASGYNMSYIINNKIGPGAQMSIAKAGDIIPEVQKVIVESTEEIVLPKTCPACGGDTVYNGVHLTCPNENCSGRISKKLASASKVLGLKGLGDKRLEPFSKDFPNMYELWKKVLTDREHFDTVPYEIPNGERMHEIFINAFLNIKSIPYDKVVQILGYDNVGKSLSKQLAIEHSGGTADYTGLEKALIVKLHSEEIETYIKDAISSLESLGVIIDRPVDKTVDDSLIPVCMTGSPKACGFATKKVFLEAHPNLYEEKLKDATYLITDDLSSTSSKMKDAAKRGILIKTYNDF